MAIAPTTEIAENQNASATHDGATARSLFKKMFHEEILQVTEGRSKGYDPDNRLPPQIQWLFNTCERAYVQQEELKQEVQTLKDQVAALTEVVAKLAKKGQ